METNLLLVDGIGQYSRSGQGLIHNNYIVYTLHDAVIGTCGLYTRWTICRLLLLHNDYRTWGLHTKIHELHVTGKVYRLGGETDSAIR